MYIYGATVGFFFWQQSQFLIDKPSITFLIAFHTCFLYEAYLNSIQATDVVVLCIKYHKIMSDCKVQIAQALHCKHSVIIMEHCFITAFSSCFYVVDILLASSLFCWCKIPIVCYVYTVFTFDLSVKQRLCLIKLFYWHEKALLIGTKHFVCNFV